MSMSFRSLLVGAAVVFSAVFADAEEMVFWPSKAKRDVDHYNWNDAAGWWTDRKQYKPSTASGRCPGVDDNVYLTMTDLTNTPLVISGDVSISNLYLAATADSHGTYPDGYGKGTWLRMTGGTLDVKSFVFANNNASWGKFDLEGGTMNVASGVNLGVNQSATEWSRLTIGETAKLNVRGNLAVGVRSAKTGFALTNAGEVVCSSLHVGPASSSYDGTGVVYSVGSISVSGDVSIAANNKTASAGYLYLKEGSTFVFGTEQAGTLSIGGKGLGVLDTEVPLDITGNALKLGNGGGASRAYLKLRKNASLSGLSTLAIANQQYGRAFLEMYDNSRVNGVSMFDCGDSSGCDVGVSLADNACITNVRTIRAAATTGTRTGGKFTFAMSDNAKVVFTNATTKGNTLKAYNRDGARGDFFFGGNSRVEGVESFSFACDQREDLGGTVRFEGGTMVYRMTYGDVAFNLGQSRSHASATMRLSGYGKVTRDDLASPNSNRILMYCDFPEFRIEADGMGENRDLDLAAVGRFNTAYQVNAGTNGWFAVNKGRLIYPRANKDLGGYSATQPERTVGDYSQPGLDDGGNPNPPTLFGSFNVHFQFLAGATGNKAYLYAAQYAADRDDYPTPERFRTCKALNIYRLGAAADWTDDEPQDPYTFKTVDCNFCYDTTGLSGTVPVNLYYNTGRPGANWRKVASNADNPKSGLIRSKAVGPVDGADWNIGWYAVVEGEVEPLGLTIIVK